MDSERPDPSPVNLRDRLTRSWFPPAAIVGALAALFGASLRVRPTPKPGAAGASPSAAPSLGPNLAPAAAPTVVRPEIERQYALVKVLAGATSTDPFRRYVAGVAADSRDRLFVLGDDEVRTYNSDGSRVGSWRAVSNARCLGIGPDGRVYVGAASRVEIFDSNGNRVGGFEAGDRDRPAEVTAIKVFDGNILVADASARIVRRYDALGRQLGVIGDQTKTGSFMLPNRALDIAVDSRGIVLATDTGRHQVTSWALDGKPIGKFGKFGMLAPEDFVGCCNPVNIAVTRDGRIVTGEKMVARVKVFEPDGRLVALIGPDNFHPGCTHIFLSVDSKGRIVTADNASREVKIFSPAARPRNPAPGTETTKAVGG